MRLRGEASSWYEGLKSKRSLEGKMEALFLGIFETKTPREVCANDLNTINVNKRVEMLTKPIVIKEEVEEYEASPVDTNLVLETSQTFEDQLDVADIKVEEFNYVVEDKIAEIRIFVPRHNFFVKSSSKSFQESFDCALDSVINQIKKQKEKQAVEA